jgi:hypothetical protein
LMPAALDSSHGTWTTMLPVTMAFLVR